MAAVWHYVHGLTFRSRLLVSVLCLVLILSGRIAWRWYLHESGHRQLQDVKQTLLVRDWYCIADEYLAQAMPSSLLGQQDYETFYREFSGLSFNLSAIEDTVHQPWLCGYADPPKAAVRLLPKLGSFHKGLDALLNRVDWGVNVAAQWAQTDCYRQGGGWYQLSRPAYLGFACRSYAFTEFIDLLDWRAALAAEPRLVLSVYEKVMARLYPPKCPDEVPNGVFVHDRAAASWLREIRRGRIDPVSAYAWINSDVDLSSYWHALCVGEVLLFQESFTDKSTVGHPERLAWLQPHDDFRRKGALRPFRQSAFLHSEKLGLFVHPDYTHAARDQARIIQLALALRDYWLAPVGQQLAAGPDVTACLQALHDTLPAMNFELTYLEKRIVALWKLEARLRAYRLAAWLWLQVHHGLPFPQAGADLPARFCDPYPADRRYARIVYQPDPAGGFTIMIDFDQALPQSVERLMIDKTDYLLLQSTPWQYRAP